MMKVHTQGRTPVMRFCLTFPRRAGCIGLGLILIAALPPASAQPIGPGPGWSVRVGDQALQMADAGFHIPNVTVRDEDRDRIGDVPLRIYATGLVDGVRIYGVAEVLIRDAELIEVDDNSFTITDQPFNLPARLFWSDCDPTLQVGDSGRCLVQAARSDGAVEDVSSDTLTRYTSSDPSILSVDDTGWFTARRPGEASIAAVNDGISAVTRFSIRAATVATTVEGFLLKPDGTPAAGLTVTSSTGGGVSDAAGKFSIPLIVPPEQSIALSVFGQINGQTFAASKSGMVVMPDAIIDAGLIEVTLQDEPSWTGLAPYFSNTGVLPSYAVAYDEGRDVLVLYGVLASSFGSGSWLTWEWSRADGWRLMANESKGEFLTPCGMVYDEARGTVVRVSLEHDDSFTFLMRTYEWRGAAWTLRSEDGPSARTQFGLTYDRSRQRVCLIGGLERTYYDAVADTFWEWDGTQWTQRPETGPSGASLAVYDASRERLVAFAFGVGDFTNMQIWEFDGSLWSLRRITGIVVAAALSRPTAAFDPTEGLTWLFSFNAQSGQQERWLWNGVDLVRRSSETQSIYGTAPAFWFDAPLGVTLSYSGVRTTNSGRTATNVIRSVTGPAFLSESPNVRLGPLVFDEARGYCILSGGNNGNVPADSWAWDGQSWRQLVSTNHPSFRVESGMAYDATAELVVLHGGWLGGGTALMSDTWIWNGSDWTQAATAGPSGRFGHQMAYDRTRQRMVLFGGRISSDANNPATYLAETWEWDGQSWTQQVVSGPSGRMSFGLAYDEVRQVTVLHGGVFRFGTLSDTWEWDGIAWTLKTATGPSVAGAMIYDLDRQRCVMQKDGTLYEWDGTNWTTRTLSAPIKPLGSSNAMAYDRVRRRAVLHYGQDGVHTWELGSP